MPDRQWVDQAGNRLLLLDRGGGGRVVWQMCDAQGRYSEIAELAMEQQLAVLGYLELHGVGVLRNWLDWDGDELRILQRTDGDRGVLVAIYSHDDGGPLAPVELSREQTRELRGYLAEQLRQPLRAMDRGR